MKLALILVMILITTTTLSADAPDPGVRPAAVAGRFYEQDPARLQAGVDALLAAALPSRPGRPVALLSPHAGYIFSGQLAADAWRQAAGHPFDLIVILGTNHTAAPFRGASVFPGAAYRTPLGICSVDRDLAARLLVDHADLCRFDAAYHRREHSVEVQVPFAQTVLPGVPILPLVVATNHPETCAELGRIIADAVAGRRALIVASSDLSHYPDAATAVATDSAVLAAAATLAPDRVSQAIADLERRGLPGLDTCACGEGALLVMLHAARRLGANHATVLDRLHSGETVLGDNDRVVGYGALLLSERDEPGRDTAALTSVKPPPPTPLDPTQQAALLDHARRTVTQYLATGTAPIFRVDDPRLTVHQGAFVTFNDNGGRLRGCIGHLAEDRPLGEVVGAMAIQSAVNDRRFEPVNTTELADLHLEISVLTPARAVPGPDAVRVGIDGVIIRKGARQAVFLPQVATEQGWDRDTLLAQLCRKAGLGADDWRKPGCTFLTFQAQVFGEH